MAEHRFRFFVTVVLFICGSCATSVPIDRAVVSYDETTTRSVEEQLLLNIARAHKNEPIHFTAVSNIAATYRVTANAGFGPAMTGSSGGTVVPSLNVSAESSPTISIAPMQGDEFTQRLLTPFRESQLTLLLRQGYDVDSLLRLLGAEVRLEEGKDAESIYLNRPSDPDGYRKFRQVMSHLSTVQDRHALYTEPLHFNVTWDVPIATVTPETFSSTYTNFTLVLDQKAGVFHVTHRVNGRVMISNYDPDTLSNDDRVLLHKKADEEPYNDVLLDIRHGYPGGEIEMHGRIRLRSIHEVLTFLGRGMGEEPEFDVAPDPRTPKMTENPVNTIAFVEANAEPDAPVTVRLEGKYYAVKTEPGYQWNQKTFSVLYQLFQMSVSTSSAPAGPSITIAK